MQRVVTLLAKIRPGGTLQNIAVNWHIPTPRVLIRQYLDVVSKESIYHLGMLMTFVEVYIHPLIDRSHVSVMLKRPINQSFVALSCN